MCVRHRPDRQPARLLDAMLDKAVIREWRERETVAQIAKQTGCSERWIFKVCGPQPHGADALRVAYRRVMIARARLAGVRGWRLEALFGLGKASIYNASCRMDRGGDGVLSYDFTSLPEHRSNQEC
jgi:hypothetical protein